MLIDAHAHLDKYLYRKFNQPVGKILDEIERARILTINMSMDMNSCKKNQKFKSDCVIQAFGIHPWRAHLYENKTGLLRKMIGSHDFIGEIGLDQHFVKDPRRHKAQNKVFETFLSHSEGKILSVHSKGAEEQVHDKLKKYGVKAVLHWYSGDLGTLKKLIGQDHYFSINYEIKVSERIRKIAELVPLKQILSETDNPGARRWIDGKIGMPLSIRNVVTELGKVKGLGYEQMGRQIRNNYMRLTKDILTSDKTQKQKELDNDLV